MQQLGPQLLQAPGVGQVADPHVGDGTLHADRHRPGTAARLRPAPANQRGERGPSQSHSLACSPHPSAAGAAGICSPAGRGPHAAAGRRDYSSRGALRRAVLCLRVGARRRMVTAGGWRLVRGGGAGPRKERGASEGRARPLGRWLAGRGAGEGPGRRSARLWGRQLEAPRAEGRSGASGVSVVRGEPGPRGLSRGSGRPGRGGRPRAALCRALPPGRAGGRHDRHGRAPRCLPGGPSCPRAARLSPLGSPGLRV